jgi:signal transduction histidine kinase
MTDTNGPRRAALLAETAGEIAHEFNNLLGVILNYAMLVDRVLPPGDPAHEDVAEIRRAADRATDLTRRLQSAAHDSQLEPGRPPQS